MRFNGERGSTVNVRELLSLQGKKALVTGGGRGLGEQMARGLAEAGADVVLCSRKRDACAEVAKDIAQGTGREVLALSLDVADRESVRLVCAEAERQFGRIDILVNNAGISWGAPELDMPLEKWEQVMRVNATGAFLMAQELGRGMVAREYGRVINIASIAGFLGTDPEVMNAVGYHASKGAVIALTRDLAVKWARRGVTVNAVAPGFFPSKMSKPLLEKSADKILARVPMGRFGGEGDLKGLVVYLASDASSYVTGQVFAVDGGLSAS